MLELMHINETNTKVGLELPLLVKMSIEKQLIIYDTEYGNTRDQFKDDGGYIAVIEKLEDFSILAERHNLVFTGENGSIAEYVDKLITNEGNYYQMLFLLGNDYGLIVVVKEDILPEEARYRNEVDFEIKTEDDLK